MYLSICMRMLIHVMCRPCNTHSWKPYATCVTLKQNARGTNWRLLVVASDGLTICYMCIFENNMQGGVADGSLQFAYTIPLRALFVFFWACIGRLLGILRVFLNCSRLQLKLLCGSLGFVLRSPELAVLFCGFSSMLTWATANHVLDCRYPSFCPPVLGSDLVPVSGPKIWNYVDFWKHLHECVETCTGLIGSQIGNDLQRHWDALMMQKMKHYLTNGYICCKHISVHHECIVGVAS